MVYRGKVLPKAKVAVGLSGGVDSAVAAALLKRQGCQVFGIHLYCFDEGPYCTADEDRASAVRVAKHLGIPLLIWDLRREYQEKVMSYFFDEYKVGRTPNPDIVCNREIKFGIFMKKARAELGVDYVATGHYARIVKSSELGVHSRKNIGTSTNYEPRTQASSARYHLLRGVDESKDQSYFLYQLTQRQLEHILFPIGNYRKEEVRKLAKEFGLPNADRPDSQGICFIGLVPVSKFLRERLPIRRGPVINTGGEVIGEHDGVWFYTEGQRHGFRVPKSSLPLYVLLKDSAANTLVVGRGKEAEVREFQVEKPYLINEDYKSGILGGGISVRIRHLGALLSAVACPIKSSSRLVVQLSVPARGVASGQSAVFYRGEEVLGGAVVKFWA